MSPEQPPELPHGRTGKARADRELRIALAIAIPLLAIGQVLLLTGLRWVAMFGIALPGTVVALVLARRWQAMASQDR
jgi:hypothetical protein